MVKMNQFQQILNHLIDRGPITVVQAAEQYQVRSLTKLMCNLREAGFNIVGTWLTDPVTGRRFKQYRLAS
jgi:hypothetical protein